VPTHLGKPGNHGKSKEFNFSYDEKCLFPFGSISASLVIMFQYYYMFSSFR
jgi:hypothetical protein